MNGIYLYFVKKHFLVDRYWDFKHSFQKDSFHGNNTPILLFVHGLGFVGCLYGVERRFQHYFSDIVEAIVLTTFPHNYHERAIIIINPRKNIGRAGD